MSGQVKDSEAPVSANLLAELKRTGITNTALAQALGISERQITRWRGGTVPRYGYVQALAGYFGRPTEWFYAAHDREAA